MSEAPDWVNLNPDPDDSQSSNFYYNQEEQQFSFAPIYKKEELSTIINSIKSKCNYINFDYLKQFDEFKDVLGSEREQLKDLTQYADEDLFLNYLGKELHKTEPKPKKNMEIYPKTDKKFNVKRKNPSNFSEKIQKPNFKEELEELDKKEEETEEKSIEIAEDDELTFKDLKNFNLQKANNYRLTSEELIKPIDFKEKAYDYFSLLQEFFKIVHNETITIESKQKETGEFTSRIFLCDELLVEFEGPTDQKSKENLSQLLLAYFCPVLLKNYQENLLKESKRKKLKTNNGVFLMDFNKSLRLSPVKSQKSDRDFVSNESNEERKENKSENFNEENEENEENARNYKELMPKKLTEEELRVFLDEVLKKRLFTFNNFLSEMKTEILKISANKDKRIVERNTMKLCLNTLENLFKYYKLVTKQSQIDDILIFSHNHEGEFKVSIMKLLENGEKKLIAYGCNAFKSFALYFALNNFFEVHLGGSFTPINKVYNEIKKKDKGFIEWSEETKNEGGLEMVSQDLLNEIDNYTQVLSLNKNK